MNSLRNSVEGDLHQHFDRESHLMSIVNDNLTTSKLNNQYCLHSSTSLTNIFERTVSPTTFLSNSISELKLLSINNNETYDFNEDIVLVDEATTINDDTKNSTNCLQFDEIESNTSHNTHSSNNSSRVSLSNLIYEIISSDEEEDLNLVIFVYNLTFLTNNLIRY